MDLCFTPVICSAFANVKIGQFMVHFSTIAAFVCEIRFTCIKVARSLILSGSINVICKNRSRYSDVCLIMSAVLVGVFSFVLYVLTLFCCKRGGTNFQ